MLQSRCLRTVGRAPAPFTAAKVGPRVVVARNNPMGMNPAMAAQLQKAMQDPKFAEQMKQMQQMMQRPEMQQQLAQMQQVMQNEQLKQRMAQLKDDPEFAEAFAEIQKGGMGALMKYYNNPEFLAKLGEKLGDIPAAAAGGPAAAPAAAPPGADEGAAPEINNLRDAAKYGDEEAVEDFLAIGKDPNEADAQGRTALHYSAAFDQPIIAKMLLDEGAETDPRDAMQNTPLHYAAGYGRPALARMLLDAGANKDAQNSTGKRPADLAKLDERNPLNADAELMARLA